MRALRSVGRTISAGAAGILLAGAWLVLGADPAQAQTPFVAINPPNVQAGSRVGITASCGDDVNQATVESAAFGQIVLIPQGGFLVGSVTIPANTRAARYNVKLSCPNNSVATTTLNVINSTRPAQTLTITITPTRGPAAGGGGTAGGGNGSLILAGGLATVGFGAVLGLIALRRRRTALGG